MSGPKQLQWYVKISSLSSTLLGCAVWTPCSRTTLDAAGKIQLMKVSANQIFHNFNELAHPYSDLPKNIKGKQIKKSE
eukprot:12508678-Ditylum_brightwellii.AAC.1